MSAAQSPVVGRAVWVWMPATNFVRNMGGHAPVALAADQPFAATICFVHPDGMVNVLATDHVGQQFPFGPMPLGQPTPCPSERFPVEECHGIEDSKFIATWPYIPRTGAPS